MSQEKYRSLKVLKDDFFKIKKLALEEDKKIYAIIRDLLKDKKKKN